MNKISTVYPYNEIALINKKKGIPGLGRPPGEGNGNLLQYSYLGNPMDRGARQASLVGVFATTELQSWAQFRD